MKSSSFKVNRKASLSLASLFNRRTKKRLARMAMRSAGFNGPYDEVVRKDDFVSLIVSSDAKIIDELPDLRNGEKIEQITDSLYSAHVTLDSAAKLYKSASVHQLQTKKKKSLHLDDATTNIGLRTSPTAMRALSETGKNVLIGIVDSGFDLQHPMFRDATGQLRVRALLDQTTGKEFSTNQLGTAWSGAINPKAPGGDDNGHGTHVATIAGGTKFGVFEGVAPESEFLLVKTDFLNTDTAVSWIFQQAATDPCVINMSLGHHWGAHDGSEQEERLHEALIGPGKLIVVSAGNERTDSIHIGGRWVNDQIETVRFRIFRQPEGAPFAALTLWYDEIDDFDFALITPSGQELKVPKPGNAANFSGSQIDVELGHLNGSGAGGASGKVQITIEFSSIFVPNSLLANWGIRIRCSRALIGRVDGWFNNSGFAEFHPHALVETTRTIGLPASGNGCIAVASHVTKRSWDSDNGLQSDPTTVLGRNSPFSSQGPTRDARQKPEISAPGQYLVAGLASGSDLSRVEERADNAAKLLSIEGTSMAAPMVTGALALMLQRKPKLSTQQVIDALKNTSVVDGHTSSVWNPAYGHGKLDIAEAIDSL